MAANNPNTFGSNHFFSDAYSFFDGQLNTFLNQHYQNVVDAVKGPLTGAIVIYIALYAFMIMRGIVSEPFQDWIWRMAKVCLLFVAATTVAYQDWIVGPIFNAAPSAVTQAISGKDYKQAGSTFDDLESKAAETYNSLRTEADAQPFTNLGIALEDIIVALVLELAAVIACIVGFALTIFALVGLAITIALGPIFIALSLFEWGRGMFQGWLRQAFNYVVQLAVITAMAALIVSLGDSILQSNTGADPVNHAMFLIVYYSLGAFFFFQAPGIAAGITGGAGLSAGEVFAGAAAVSTLGAARAARAMERIGGARPGGRGARWAANKLRNRNAIQS